VVKSGDFIADVIAKPGFSGSRANQHTTNTTDAPSEHNRDHLTDDSATLRYIKRVIALRFPLNQWCPCFSCC
jgi:hypothetical protein